jgi:predicted transcriptional regulator
MKQALIDELVQTLFRLKQIETAFRTFSLTSARKTPPQHTPPVAITGFIVLKGIQDHVFDSGETTIPDVLCISRAAVSRMLGVMEKKGYILRNINEANRRKHSLSLTEKGIAAVERHEHRFTELLAEIIERFGEEELRQLTGLSGRFMETIGKIKAEW